MASSLRSALNSNNIVIFRVVVFVQENRKMSFKLVAKATVDDSIEVSKFRSESTGLSVVIAEVEGPVVNGHFALGKLILLLLFYTAKSLMERQNVVEQVKISSRECMLEGGTGVELTSSLKQ